MKAKKTVASVLVLVISISIMSCGGGKNQKSGPLAKTLQEVRSNDTSGSPSSAISPAGTLTLDNLPAGIEKNYAGYTMVVAAPDPLCQGGDAIDVAITKAGSPNLSLIFKPDGSFVQQEQDLPLSTATARIREVLKTKYAGYSADVQIEKLTLADKSVQYLIDLSKGNLTKEVIFSADGSVVCEH
jgi:hypothetical protein